MSDLLTSVHMTVYKLHDLARVEAVGLAQVYEQTFEASLCLARAAAAVGCASCLASALCVALVALVGGLENLGRVGIIFEEAAKLKAHDLLQDVFLVNKLEVAVDVVHEGSDLLLVHIGLLYLVNGLIELLGAYLLRCGQRSVDKILAYLALNVAHLTLLACVYDAYAGALLSCSSCTSRTVRVALDVVGQTIVDDVCQVVHVQSACCHVGSHEELCEVLAKLLHGEVALLL